MLKKRIAICVLVGFMALVSMQVSYANIGTLSETKSVPIVDAKLNQEVLDNITFDDAPGILSEINAFILAYPDMSKKDIDSFVVMVLNQKYKNATLNSYGLPFENKLNEKEKELFNDNKLKGLRVLNLGYNANSRANSRYTEQSVKYGNGDAFRHALWSALMTEEFSEYYAKQWGDAHEYNEVEPHKEMDLYNNAKGRYLVTTVGGGMDSPYWQPRLEGTIAKEIDAGNLKRLENNSIKWSDSSGKK